MTKKILALALAGTTAFSVFASAMSVSAEAQESYTFGDFAAAYTAKSYTPVTIANTWTTGKYAREDYDNTVKAFKTLYDYVNGDTIYTNDDGDVLATPSSDDIKTGMIYVYDYDSVKAKAFKTALADFNEAYTAAGSPTGDFAADTENTAATTLLTALKTAETAIITAIEALDGEALNTSISAAGARRDAHMDFEDLLDRYLAPENYDPTSSDFDKYYDDNDTPTNAADDTGIYVDITNIKTSFTSKPTSYLTWLVARHDELVAEMYAQSTVDIDTMIESYKNILDARSVEDYKSEASFKAFDAEYTKLVEDYDEKTTVSKRSEYRNKLRDLILKKHGDSAGADKDALKALIEDGDRIVDDTAGYKQTGAEWTNFTAVLAEAKKVSALSAKGSYQSTIDAYVEWLSDVISEVSVNGSVSNWQWVRLENAIEAAEALDENDYAAASWKKFITARDRAVKTLENGNASSTLVINAASALETAMTELKAKAVPSATKKALQDALKNAKTVLAGMDSSSSGYQMVALTTAISNADALFSDNKQTSLKNTTLISDVNEAIAALEAALTSANQPQGWYTNEAGKWMFGEGDGYYVDGWKKIGNFWFEFDANGVAKQNEWVNEGGKWYYFGNSCVAYTGWGKIDGKWYYFGKDCAMVTGWIQLGTTWYYLTPGNGEMVTGWATIGGKSYYFSKEANTLGAMLANTTTPDGYKVGADGAWVK